MAYRAMEHAVACHRPPARIPRGLLEAQSNPAPISFQTSRSQSGIPKWRILESPGARKGIVDMLTVEGCEAVESVNSRSQLSLSLSL